MFENLTKFEIAAIKRYAKNAKPNINKVIKLDAKINALIKQKNDIEAEINMFEAPVIEKYGMTSTEILSMLNAPEVDAEGFDNEEIIDLRANDARLGGDLVF